MLLAANVRMNQVPHRSILIVEDDPLLAMDLEWTLQRAGFAVIGPAITTEEAFNLLHRHTPDLIILDLNLDSETGFPVADRLVKAGIPFLILSGHSRSMVPAPYRNRPFVQKPCAAATLLRKVRAVLNAGGDHATPGAA
jgi:DNA-binding response OmpR family regulator